MVSVSEVQGEIQPRDREQVPCGMPQFLLESKENNYGKTSTIDACICSNSPLACPLRRQCCPNVSFCRKESKGLTWGRSWGEHFSQEVGRTERRGWTVMGKRNRWEEKTWEVLSRAINSLCDACEMQGKGLSSFRNFFLAARLFDSKLPLRHGPVTQCRTKFFTKAMSGSGFLRVTQTHCLYILSKWKNAKDLDTRILAYWFQGCMSLGKFLPCLLVTFLICKLNHLKRNEKMHSYIEHFAQRCVHIRPSGNVGSFLHLLQSHLFSWWVTVGGQKIHSSRTNPMQRWKFHDYPLLNSPSSYTLDPLGAPA